MRRDKKWWARYTSDERSWIVWFELAQNRYGGYGGMLPDDTTECQCCGNPSRGNICGDCMDRFDVLMQRQPVKELEEEK